MFSKRLIQILLTVPLSVGCASIETGQHPQKFETQVTKTVAINYLLYLPEGYDKKPRHDWPLMLFLHGAGERGNDLDRVKIHGPAKRAETDKDFPFILVSPQCPEDEWWTVKIEVLDALLNDISKRYRVDEKRIYATGLSMGGYGTWALAAQFPERFAAIAPVCGGGSPDKAPLLKDLPIWVFHGAKDTTVPLDKSQEMVDAIKKAGGEPRFTIYPDAGHDSWTETYDNPELYSWFLKHERK